MRRERARVEAADMRMEKQREVYTRVFGKPPTEPKPAQANASTPFHSSLFDEQSTSSDSENGDEKGASRNTLVSFVHMRTQRRPACRGALAPHGSVI